MNQRKHWIIGKFGLPPFKRPLVSAADTLRFRGQNLGGTPGKWIFIPSEVLSHDLDVASYATTTTVTIYVENPGALSLFVHVLLL